MSSFFAKLEWSLSGAIPSMAATMLEGTKATMSESKNREKPQRKKKTQFTQAITAVQAAT